MEKSVKSTLNLKIILTIILFSYPIYLNANELEIIVDISEQRLFVIEKDLVKESFPVSTSKYGEGEEENSYKTPLGKHEIKEKIGEGAKINTIFVARLDTKKESEIITLPQDTEDDHVTSRILWLDGLEDGVNKGQGVDSFNRYIYIHGTHEEGLIGTKASHGCIRMFNNDVIYLYDIVKKGTKVYIKA